jgi:hypothetical protein
MPTDSSHENVGYVPPPDTGHEHHLVLGVGAAVLHILRDETSQSAYICLKRNTSRVVNISMTIGHVYRHQFARTMYAPPSLWKPVTVMS